MSGILLLAAMIMLFPGPWFPDQRLVGYILLAASFIYALIELSKRIPTEPQRGGDS